MTLAYGDLFPRESCGLRLWAHLQWRFNLWVSWVACIKSTSLQIAFVSSSWRPGSILCWTPIFMPTFQLGKFLVYIGTLDSKPQTTCGQNLEMQLLSGDTYSPTKNLGQGIAWYLPVERLAFLFFTFEPTVLLEESFFKTTSKVFLYTRVSVPVLHLISHPWASVKSQPSGVLTLPVVKAYVFSALVLNLLFIFGPRLLNLL